MKIEWNRVTWYSKLAAVAVFLATFGIAFVLGILYEQVHVKTALIQTSALISPPIGGARVPQATGGVVKNPESVGVGEHCGGFIQNAPVCAVGLHCKLGRIPDTGGVCVADSN